MNVKYALERICGSAVAFALVLVGLSVAAGVTAPAAEAADAPVVQRSVTGVTADALPTVQVNGVVWDQAVAGNTVYAGGQFTSARPAGAAAGTNETGRTNLLAFDITTGALNTSFNPVINGTVKVLALSPDKSRLYVGGAFTSVNGTQHNRIVAFSTATGQVVSSFSPNLDAQVMAISVTNTTVYVGGIFSTANGVARSRLAAFSPTTGSLLGWAPSPDLDVNALLVTPDGSKLIAAGAFGTVNGSTAQGLAALDPSSGALLPWIANTVVKDYGSTAAMLSLKTDGTTIYGSGYWFGGTGNYEGVWSADPSTGAIKWLADCHGDTYDVAPLNGVVYSVSHHHTCDNIASFPEQNPRQHYRAQAFTAETAGTVRHNSQAGYGDFYGYGAPSQVNWFPEFSAGTFTGQSQAGWTVEGNGDYVVVGGEFPSVNGTRQQGLVRFAVPSKAPRKQGNQIFSADSAPTLRALAGNAVRVAWKTNWDRDDALLTYQVRRSDLSTPVYTASDVQSLWWKRQPLAFIDNTVKPNTTYTYTIRENDPDGNAAFSASVSVTTGSDTLAASDYSKQVQADGAADYWRLNDPAGSTTAIDWAGASDLNLGSGVALGAAGAISGTDAAATFNGTSSGTSGSSNWISGPTVFTTEAWVKTASTSGGKIVGFGSAATGTSSSYDRHLYMDNSGRISFGVYPGAVRALQAPKAYNDNQWHQVVGSLSASGLVLYVDGVKIATDPSVTSAQEYAGYWRVGGDTTGSWPNAGSSQYFAGSIDDVAIYPTALSAAQVRDHYLKSGRTATNAKPTASFTASCNGGACTFDGSGSTDSDGTLASYGWDFGDGVVGTGVAVNHSFTASGSYPVKLTVTDNENGTGTTTQTVTVTVSPANQPPTARFTSSCKERVCSFDGTTSSDPDGTIATYVWDFGDGSTSTVPAPAHTFAIDGTYPVKLTVTDNRGGTNSSTTSVRAANNVPPAASFTTSCTTLKCDVDASASSDPDGTIVTYLWSFGDGSSASGVTASHTYAVGGSYVIKLTATDDKGAIGTQSKNVTVAAAANATPTASFTNSVANLTASVDASASADPDGVISSYDWTFGDGSTGTGKTTSHTYASSGTYAVKLTVTDNAGGSGTLTKQVTVGGGTVAADTFSRTGSGWGTANTGGAWALTSAQRFSTNGSVGKIAFEAKGTGATAALDAVSATNPTMVADVTVDKLTTGGGAQAIFQMRRQSGSAYNVKLLFLADGSLAIGSTKLVNGTETSIRQNNVSGLTYAPGDVLRVRFAVSGTGSTTLTGKVWKAGSAEPATNQLTTTDATASLQSGGSVAIQGYLSGSSTNAPVTFGFDNLLVTSN